MGNVGATATHLEVMPEVLVWGEDGLLLVRGQEKGRTFWWPPGAYWIDAGTCSLESEQPGDWIERVVADQVGVTVERSSLRGVSIIHPAHSPVLLYEVTVSGDPTPNRELGFDAAGYFPLDQLPSELGRDDEHGAWLKDVAASWR